MSRAEPTADERAAVIELCQRILASLPSLSSTITERIRAALDDYRLVPLPEHVASVGEQQARLVRALMEARAPNEDDLAGAAALGRARAAQGVSVESLIGAYHIGNRMLWETIVAEAGGQFEWLPSLAGLMWESIEVVGAQIAAAHSTVAKSRQAREITLRYRFTELLMTPRPGPEAAEAAVALGFDPSGWFAVAVLDRPEAEDEAPAESAAAAASSPMAGQQPRGPALPVVWTRQERGIIAVVQTPDAPSALAAICGIVEGHRVGLGLPRQGLDGASASLLDARRCLALAGEANPVVRFDQHWLEATVFAEAGHLAPLITQAARVAADSPHLAEALAEFGDSGFSVAEAGRRLHVHANSVAYRLDRWQALTGLNPRSLEGLNRSLLAISWAQAGGHHTADSAL